MDLLLVLAQAGGTHNSTAAAPGGVTDQAARLVGEGVSSLKLDTYWERLSPLLAQYGFKVLGALVFFVIALFVSRALARALGRALDRAHVELTLSRFLMKVTRVVILVLAVVACLPMFGVEPTSFAAMIGASGLAVGLAMQGALSNLSAGAMLAILRPFKVGDAVVVAGQSGIVNDIDLFTTRLDTPDNRRIIVPNGEIFGKIIENMTHNPVRRADFAVSVAFGADVDETRRVLEAALERAQGKAKTPASEVMLEGFSDAGVNWRVFVWAPKETLGVVRQAAAREVKRGLEEAGIGGPVPRREVRVVERA